MKNMMRKCALAATAFLMSVLLGQLARAEEQRIELQTRPGVTDAFLVTPPPGPPFASMILFTGGPGILGKTMKNFLIRSRGKFAAAGFLVASIDVPSDRASGYDAVFRGSAEHARDIAAVIAWLRQKVAVKVWLVGTSTGTISAANAAARLRGSAGGDGLVMTSTFVPATSPPPSIPNVVDVAAITIPTLFVHNRNDDCETSQFQNVMPLMDRFTHASPKELLVVAGGSVPQSGPCDSFARHGYFGIEDDVIAQIVRWIKSRN